MGNCTLVLILEYLEWCHQVNVMKSPRDTHMIFHWDYYGKNYRMLVYDNRITFEGAEIESYEMFRNMWSEIVYPGLRGGL